MKKINATTALAKIVKILAGIDPNDLTKAERQILDIINSVR